MTADLPRVRAGFAERDAAVSRLGEAYAAGCLDDAEYQERSDRAVSARFCDELDGLVGDLPHLPVGPADGAPSALRPATGQVGGSVNLVAVLGGVERQGDWQVPSRVGAFSLFGGVELDLRRSVWPADGAVRVVCGIIMAGATIKVPEGVRVVNDVVAILGGVETKGLRPERTGPVLQIGGVVVMAGLSVVGPDSPEWLSDEERRSRRRAESRQRRRLGR